MSDNQASLQLKIHNLHQKMQEWAKDLPMRLQQRMSCELLANLSGCLVSDNTVFEIVNSLIDIQHFVEKEMFHNRKRLMNEYSAQILSLTSEGLPDDEFEVRKTEIHMNHKKALKKYDVYIVKELDEKAKEQQSALESAGVPGFWQTEDQLEIQVQMCLLDFIIRSKISHDT